MRGKNRGLPQRLKPVGVGAGRAAVPHVSLVLRGMGIPPETCATLLVRDLPFERHTCQADNHQQQESSRVDVIRNPYLGPEPRG
jgi:hypothetical protein